MISVLDRKLLRDLRRIWAQVLAIAMVLACGVAVLVLANGAQLTLTETRDSWYDHSRFADVFATATRAPLSLTDRIAEIDGMAQVEARISDFVILDMPGMAAPAMGRVVSLPEAGEPVLNIPLVRVGRLPDPTRADEVAVSERFALAHDLAPGRSFHAILNGQRRELTVTGWMLSPEFIYAIGPGTLIPDDGRFGILWMGHDGAAAAFDMEGAFDEVSLRLTPGASVPAVVRALDDLLDPYGGTGAHGRDRQMSHAFLQSELDQLSAMAVVLPPVFFIVSAFLVNMVIGRLIALERQQIGLLKAVGYSTPQIAGHYLKLSIGIGVVGLLIGWALGAFFAGRIAGLYAQYFSFPYLVYVPSPGAFVLSGSLAVATVVLGALRAVWASVRLSPAVAMSPPAPPKYSRGMADRIGALLRLKQTTMMILRSLIRWPGRAAITVFGVAASVSVLVASFFSFDAMDAMVDDAFYQSNRAGLTLMLSQTRSPRVVEDARSLPGALQVEGVFAAPVRLTHGPHEKFLQLQAQPEGAELLRVLGPGGGEVPMPPAGVVMPAAMAEDLGLRAGDMVSVEFLVPPRETHLLQITAVTFQALGQSLHMNETALFDLLRQGPQVNMLNLLIDDAALPDLYAQIKTTPAVSGVMLWNEMRKQFVDEIQRNLWTMVLIYSILGILITVGVVYNAARIQLSERSHELASLRVLGFTKAQVAYVLVAELMFLSLVAVPIGWWLGYLFAAATAEGFSTDIVTLPLIVTRTTYGGATAIVLVAALASALLVKRRLDRIDIVTALKQKE